MKVHNLIRGELSRILLLSAFLLLVACTTAFVVTANGPPGNANQENEGNVDKNFGSLEGVIVFEGEVPQARVVDNAGHRRDLLYVDRKTRGLRYAVAYLDSPASAAERDQSEEDPPKPVSIDQKDHTFVPHLIALRSGQSVVFTNSDTANHNVRSASLVEKQQFNVLTEAGREYKHQFFADRKVRPVLISCDIHPWMKAWIYVFDHPYFAVSNAQGRFKISGIKPGKHRLIILQPDGGFQSEQSVEVFAGQSSKVEIRVTRDALKGI